MTAVRGRSPGARGAAPPAAGPPLLSSAAPPCAAPDEAHPATDQATPTATPGGIR